MCRRNHAFTLIEIMIVVVLMSLLAGMVGLRLIKNADRTKVRIAKTMVNGTLRQALEQFYLDNHSYPTTDQGLQALVEKPSIGPEPMDYPEDGYFEVGLDPWDMPYQYVCPGVHNKNRFDLWSMGPDRQSATVDDIVNWRSK